MLTIQGYKPKEFAGQINLNVNNMWGILKVCASLELLFQFHFHRNFKDPKHTFNIQGVL